MTGLALVGFMGAGKSTVGPLLAARLGWPFVDLDALVEEREGTTIDQIFRSGGEAAFRMAERSALSAVLDRETPLVLGLGGGTTCCEASRAAIRAWGRTVYLEVPLAVLVGRVGQGAGRPLWSEASRRFIERQPIYRSCDLVVDGTLPPEQVVDAILERSC
jgi:shikimate kinase